MKSATVIAAAVYHLAMRDEMLPRFSKEQMPAPAPDTDSPGATPGPSHARGGADGSAVTGHGGAGAAVRSAPTVVHPAPPAGGRPTGRRVCFARARRPRRVSVSPREAPAAVLCNRSSVPSPATTDHRHPTPAADRRESRSDAGRASCSRVRPEDWRSPAHSAAGCNSARKSGVPERALPGRSSSAHQDCDPGAPPLADARRAETPTPRDGIGPGACDTAVRPGREAVHGEVSPNVRRPVLNLPPASLRRRPCHRCLGPTRGGRSPGFSADGTPCTATGTPTCVVSDANWQPGAPRARRRRPRSSATRTSRAWRRPASTPTRSVPAADGRAHLRRRRVDAPGERRHGVDAADAHGPRHRRRHAGRGDQPLRLPVPLAGRLLRVAAARAGAARA